MSNVQNIPVNTIDGKPSSLKDFAGNVLLVVNVASKCGLTPQYEGLERLQKTYGEQGFTVIGVPCNQFLGQEPGTAEEIQTFCSTTYGVSFPLTEKVDVNGEHAHAIYNELHAIADDQGHTGDIQWNFEKYVVASNGDITRFNPRVEPEDASVIAAIAAALA